MSSIYQINKAVGRPVVFRGLKSQYIWWLGGGLVGCLLLFALLYIVGIALLVCSCVVLVSGGCCFKYVYRMNRMYGEYGMMKKMASRAVPKWIRCDQMFGK